MKIFDIEYRKQRRKDIVNYLYGKYNQYKSDKYSDELVGFCIKAAHFIHPFTCMLLIVCAPFYISLATYAFVIGVFLMFIYLNGCFLTSLEYKINGQDITIADPIIMLCNDTINYENRQTYTIYTILLYILIATLVVVYRFY